MKLKTFWDFALTDSTDREYLKSSGSFEYIGQAKSVKDREMVRLLMNRAAMSGDTETLRFMLEHGVAVKGKQLEALSLAIDSGQEQCAVILVDAGADIGLVDRDTKQTLLHRAALKGQAETCRALLQRKSIKPDAKNAQGSTALHCAAAVGNERIVLLLLSAGANRKKRNDHANTPAHLAKLNGHTKLSELLEKGPKNALPPLEPKPPSDPLVNSGATRITRIE